MDQGVNRWRQEILESHLLRKEKKKKKGNVKMELHDHIIKAIVC